MMELYHVLNRGVDKRDIVIDDKDRVRFIHDLFAFNDAEATPNHILQKRHAEKRPRKMLVHIHVFCLMPNHYHLLISPLVEQGIPLFMKKLNMGYAKYFNEKYSRSGALWQGKYKKILVERDAHFNYIPYYIHLNPLDLKYPEWREGQVENCKEALKYLNSYRWSSHLDYSGHKNFPSLLQRNFLTNTLNPRENYEKEICNIISSPEIAIPSQNIE